MRRFPRLALIPLLTFLLASMLAVAVMPALAACGGKPCSCGDTVDTDTKLNPAVDPICSTDPAHTCPRVGLVVNSGIVLNLGGCTLRGDVGSLDGVQAGSGAQIRNGRITTFGRFGVFLVGTGGTVSNLRVSDGGSHGIAVAGSSNRVETSIVRRQGEPGNLVAGVSVEGSNNVVSRVQALENADRGVNVHEGSGNTVEKTIASRNGVVGIALFGDDNTARSNNVQDNRMAGIVTSGNNVVIENNAALRNGCGLRIQAGAGDTLTQNQARLNSFGLCLVGSGHAVSLNVVSDSSEHGILVSTTGSVLQRNTSRGNGRFGIADTTGGGGTGGTANTYIRNLCSANGAGTSTPAGLCR